jgi:hypothetical protein
LSIISRSPLSQFAEHYVPQVVQAFSQLYRVDQSPAAPVIAVQTVQIIARDQKRGDAAAVGPNPNARQIAAAGQKIGATEQIGDFNGTFQRNLTSFQLIDFLGEMR